MGSVTLPVEITRHTYEVNGEIRETLSYRPVVSVTIRPLKGGFAISGPALIDTGATMTAIDLRVAQTYGFIASGSISVWTADGEESTNPMYEVQLSGIADYAQDLVITSCSVLEQGVVALLGTDLLASCKLVYDGANGEFTLDSPT